MKELSITQKYLICVVNKKGRISGFNTEKQVCFVAAALLDLQLDNCISMDGEKVSVTGELPAEKSYLRPLYTFINQTMPMKIEKVLEEYNGSFTDRRLNELMEAVGGSLEEMGLAETSEAGIMGSKKSYTPTEAALDGVIDGIRAAMLEGGKATEKEAILVTLLEKSKSLKVCFTDCEQREIRNKLKEILNMPNGKMLKEMIEYVDSMTAAMMAAASVLGI